MNFPTVSCELWLKQDQKITFYFTKIEFTEFSPSFDFLRVFHFTFHPFFLLTFRKIFPLDSSHTLKTFLGLVCEVKFDRKFNNRKNKTGREWNQKELTLRKMPNNQQSIYKLEKRQCSMEWMWDESSVVFNVRVRVPFSYLTSFIYCH